MKLNKRKIIEITVFIVLFCTYIFPTGLISKEDNYTIPKIIFMLIICILYVIIIFQTGKLKKRELLFDIIIVFLTIYTKNINYLLFIAICFLDRIIDDLDYAAEFLKKSKILYLCLFFTSIYSVIFSTLGVREGRYAFTAIKEINQSGLSIFCLGTLLLNKNKKVGTLTLIFGLLTFSRSYYLAIICLIFFNFISKSINIKKIVDICSYWNITVISSVILILLGVFYIEQYRKGNIFWGDQLSNRLYNFLDYSNFFRFQVVIILLKIFQNYPSKLLVGMTNDEFVIRKKEISLNMNLPYKETPPHNLFFSHLKIYGVFSIIETIYISKIVKKVVDNKNFGIYIGLAFYSIFLGAGFYSYWLYLTIFVLFFYKKRSETDEKKSNNS